MKKPLIFTVVFILLLTCLSVSVFALATPSPEHEDTLVLRAGGGGGTGGGGGFFHHRHLRTADTLMVVVELAVECVLLLVAITSAVLFWLKIKKSSRKSKKLMKQLMTSDDAWKYDTVISTVKDGFYAIQTAWSSGDMTSAARYLSDELYDRYQAMLKEQARVHERNVLEKIRLQQALLIAANNNADDSRDYVWFSVKGKMIDYTINTDNGMIVSGDKRAASFLEYWQFVRKEDRWVLNRIVQENETDQIIFNT